METIEQQLNADLNSVQELLLIEARKIVSKNYSADEIKTLKELKELGFKQTKEQVDFEDWERAQRVTYYSETYPMYKFITEGAVKTICDKYHLLLAGVGDYKSDIPMVNQKAIVNFKVKEDDVKERYKFSLPSFASMASIGGRSDFWMDHVRGSFGVPSYLLGGEWDSPEPKDKKPVWKKATGLEIIAPPSKLNMEGKKIEGHCLIDKDPIVLQPVKDGYLIVTAWGFEANDDAVKNPRHN